MRVLQLIDSLATGGAERMAVNIANMLSTEIDKSFLCVTRKEGLLKTNLNKNVEYLFLNKKKTVDLKSIKRLNTYIKQNKINIIHAHSTSFFLAIIIKILNKKVSVIWHDHYGNSEYLDRRKYKVLRLCSIYFSHIFCVNNNLVNWNVNTLKAKNVSYLSNFAVLNNDIKASTKLFGKKGRRIVHLANLRRQKNHQLLVKAFAEIVKDFPEYTLHCIGKDFNDDYSKEIKNLISNLNLTKQVYLYGSKPDVTHILKQCDIGVLSSKSEGLPVALLEYGLAGLPVIATNVGNCKDVIIDDSYGLLVEALNLDEFRNSILHYIKNPLIAKNSGVKLKEHIEQSFSLESVKQELIETYKTVL